MNKWALFLISFGILGLISSYSQAKKDVDSDGVNNWQDDAQESADVHGDRLDSDDF
jgi:hypothetical protein